MQSAVPNTQLLPHVPARDAGAPASPHTELEALVKTIPSAPVKKLTSLAFPAGSKLLQRYLVETLVDTDWGRSPCSSEERWLCQ